MHGLRRLFAAWDFSRSLHIAVWVVTIISVSAHRCDGTDQDRWQREQALAILQAGLQSSNDIERVEAARALLRLDYRDEVDREWLENLAQRPEMRCEYFGVMALHDRHDADKQARWFRELTVIALDRNAIDNAQAFHELARNDYAVQVSEDNTYRGDSPDAELAELISRIASDQDDPRAPFASWIQYQNQPEVAQENLRSSLRSQSLLARLRAAHVLAQVPEIEKQTLSTLLEIRSAEPADPTIDDLIAAAIFRHRAELDDDVLNSIERQLAIAMASDRPPANRVAQWTYAVRGTADDLPKLAAIIEDESIHPVARQSAAEAVLRIQRRDTRSLAWLDWLVITLYAVGMIAVGVYYARRNVNAEEYLLGGRRMLPSLVGLSMFASLLSTLTYLAQPGEVIRYGPMTWMQLVAYPLVFVVVGYLLIPHIMRQRVTSAYEILEQHFGLSVRLLGSVIFLILRLLWMATIVYVTTDTVLIPMLGWGSNMTPVVCGVIGAITVVYTTLGGLRAVVVTDAIQTAILFGGAILAITLITVDLGGIDQWWPDGWQEHWHEPVWGLKGLDPAVRVSFIGLTVAMFTWQVCTNGSDQMAIQRFLATRDAPAARRVLAVSLTTGAIVMTLLILLGMALLAFLHHNPHVIPDDQTMLGDADKMFPTFIVRRLPMGVSGLVIAGLLAAAMSSLSSGVNSSCSVVTSDLWNRLRKKKLTQREEIVTAKWVSVIVGAVVVGLSLYVSVVPGNVFELCFRIVNLLVAPLFLLFFLAIFVKRSSAVAAWAGAIVGSIVAVLIGFWEQLFPGAGKISFVWLMPGSFAAGLAVALVVTWLLPRPK